MNDDTAITAEIVDEPSSELAVRTPVELAIIPEQPELMMMLWQDLFNELGVQRDSHASRNPRQILGFLNMIITLYPDMGVSVGRSVAFDWPTCPRYADLDQWPTYQTATP